MSHSITNRWTFIKWYNETPDARPGSQMVATIRDWLDAFWASYEDKGCPAGLVGDHECSHRLTD